MTNFVFLDELKEDVSSILSFVDFVESETTIEYEIQEVKLKFPYRVYSDDIPSNLISQFSNKQQLILHCMYSRHYNGFVRQKHIGDLLLSGVDFFAVPYIFKICDEYVLEILDVIYSNLKFRNNDDFREFSAQNKLLSTRAYSRMVSYWNEYYRDQYPNLDDYVGEKVFKECFGFSLN